MTPFPLTIVTPEGLIFDGLAEAIILRTVTGDMGILAGHINCAAPLGTGPAAVIIDGTPRSAACSGGMVTVSGGKVRLIATTFRWEEK